VRSIRARASAAGSAHLIPDELREIDMGRARRRRLSAQGVDLISLCYICGMTHTKRSVFRLFALARFIA